MPKKPLDHPERLERHYRRLGTRTPVCVTCGRCDPEHPEIYELHHVAGKSHHDDVCIECANCHRTLSDEQKDHVPFGPPPPSGVMTNIGHYLLGLADMLAMIVATLKAFGSWLINEARGADSA
jgi:hypothetical protein